MVFNLTIECTPRVGEPILRQHEIIIQLNNQGTLVDFEPIHFKNMAI